MSWLDIGDVADVVKRKKFVVTEGDAQLVVIVHNDSVFAMDNMCIHRDRELVKGMVLKNKLVCPGHQWAFALDSGWESVKELCQPTYTVRITDDGRVEIDLASRTTVAAPPACAS